MKQETTDILIKDESEFDLLLDRTHDRLFVLSNMKMSGGVLEIPLSILGQRNDVVAKKLFKKVWENDVYRAVLLINNVTNYIVNDRAQTDQCDISQLSYKDNKLVIESCLPVTIEIEVTALELVLEIDSVPSDTEQTSSFSLFKESKGSE